VRLQINPEPRLRDQRIDRATLIEVAAWIETEMRSVELAAERAATVLSNTTATSSNALTAEVRATIVVPTTGDRGPLLPLSVNAALAQTVDDIEVLIIGDGVDPTTRQIAERLCREDERVRFFDFPKHVRRGEPNRHAVLTEHARGRIAAYVCDRDLLLPDHVQELELALEGADFAHTLRFRINEHDDFRFPNMHDLTDPAVRSRLGPRDLIAPLTFVGHTMEMYRRLPHGWRETPLDESTDRYMWRQFFEHPDCRVMSSPMPTALTFKRGDHPGWSTDRRREVMINWSEKIALSGSSSIQRSVLDALWRAWAGLESKRRAGRTSAQRQQ
jgi:hypothetical protein